VLLTFGRHYNTAAGELILRTTMPSDILACRTARIATKTLWTKGRRADYCRLRNWLKEYLLN